MAISEFMRRNPVTIEPDASVREAAKKMETGNAGCVVAVSAAGRAVGILTDRDIALRVLRRGLDPDETAVSDVMEEEVVTLAPSATLTNALRRMRAYGVRRLPVVEGGEIIGIFDWNDGVKVLASELTLASRVAAAQAPSQERA